MFILLVEYNNWGAAYEKYPLQAKTLDEARTEAEGVMQICDEGMVSAELIEIANTETVAVPDIEDYWDDDDTELEDEASGQLPTVPSVGQPEDGPG